MRYQQLLPFFLCCFFLSSSLIQAQSKLSLTGKVFDSQTEQPLDYATIQVFSLPDSTLIGGGITNAEGIFSVESKRVAQLFVEVSFIGYKNQQLPRLSPKATDRKLDLGTIQLEANVAITEDIEIIAEPMEMELSLDKRVFNVGQNTTLKGGNALNVLENLPSVEVDVEGNVSLRGSGNVRILINGRPSGLAGVGSTEALRLLQSDLVERVEVITNPSARYEAEGEAGIINIILKKDQEKGLNGSVDLTAGYFINFGTALNLNYRGKNVNYFGSFGSNYRRNPGSGYFLQTNLDEFGNPEAIFEREREQMRGGLNNTLRAGADFFLSKRDLLTVSGILRRGNDLNEADLTYLDYDLEGNLIQTTTRDEDERETDNNYEVSVNYERSFEEKGRKFTADMRWILAEDEEKADQVEQIQDGETAAIIQRTDNIENEENLLFQTDYVHPFGNGFVFEVGGRTTLRTIRNDYIVEEQNEAGEFEVFGDFDDKLIYEEDIYAAYFILGQKAKDRSFSWQLGLRTEFTDIGVGSRSAETNIQKEYLNFFPSVNLSYQLDKENTVQLSYSRRLSRPRFRLLLPFSNFTDSRNIYQGNPDLDPEYTDSFEASYLTYWETGNLLGSVYYRYRTGVITRIVVTNDEGISEVFPVNLATQDAYGIELSFSQEITDWWKIGTNFNFFRAVTSGSFEERSLDNSTFAWINNLNTKISVPNAFDMQVNFIYRSPRQTAQGSRRSLSVVNIGASKDILQGRGSLTLSVRDLLNSRRRILEIDQPDFTRYDEFQWQAGTAALTFNYRFGKEQKERRRRQIRDESRSGGGE